MYRDTPSPREAISGALVALIALIVVVVIGGGLTVAGWQAGWWFNTENAKRQIKVNNIQAKGIQAGLGAQSGDLADFNNAYTSVVSIGAQIIQAPQAARQALIDQRLGIANKACADAAQITISMGSTDRAWVRANCAGSVVSPTSPLRKGA